MSIESVPCRADAPPVGPSRVHPLSLSLSLYKIDTYTSASRTPPSFFPLHRHLPLQAPAKALGISVIENGEFLERVLPHDLDR